MKNLCLHSKFYECNDCRKLPLKDNSKFWENINFNDLGKKPIITNSDFIKSHHPKGRSKWDYL